MSQFISGSTISFFSKERLSKVFKSYVTNPSIELFLNLS